MAQYLIEILGDKLDLSAVMNGDATKLPSPEGLKGKILVKVNANNANWMDEYINTDIVFQCGPVELWPLYLLYSHIYSICSSKP